jgi:CheY-like chemotaxis protein
MDSKTMESIFEPFFTTKPEGEGTGLGLAMVYSFARHNNGNIHIYSEPGEGTTFQIYLPRTKIAAEDDSNLESRITELFRSDASILIVDDEINLLELAEVFLNKLGYTTFTAENAQQALEILKQNPDIELLFSDVVMPGDMSGYELAKQARSIKPGIKILLTSGLTKKNIDSDATKETQQLFLRKPYTKEELSEALRTLIQA